MLIDRIKEMYENYRLSKYRSLFSKIKERQGSLSATEAFCVDIINMLDEPTIKQFSDFIGISQSNATYKINALIAKGYITKEVSQDDRREYRLSTTDKFRGYFDVNEEFIINAAKLLENKYSREEINKFEEMLQFFNSETQEI